MWFTSFRQDTLHKMRLKNPFSQVFYLIKFICFKCFKKSNKKTLFHIIFPISYHYYYNKLIIIYRKKQIITVVPPSAVFVYACRTDGPLRVKRIIVYISCEENIHKHISTGNSSIFILHNTIILNILNDYVRLMEIHSYVLVLCDL